MADRIPVCDSTSVGSGINPIFVKDTKIIPSSSTLGASTKPIYLDAGSLNECKELAPIDSPNFTGTPTISTPTDSSSDKAIVNKEYIDNWLKLSSEQSTGNRVGTINGTTFWSGPLAKNQEIITVNVPLLTPMWFDYKVTNNEWVYAPETDLSVEDGMFTSTEQKTIYDHLANDIALSDITKTDEFGLSDGSTISISYRLCADEHKICVVNTEWAEGITLIDNLNKLMNDPTIGCAWYFILDTTNKRFALPRTKYGFHGGLQYVKSTLNAKQRQLLYFFSGDYSNTTDKMDLVKMGVGNCTITAVTGNIATYGVGGQVVDSGRKVVNNTSTSNLSSDMTDVEYVSSKISVAKTEVTDNINTKLTTLETNINNTVDTKVTNLTDTVNDQLANQTTTVNNAIAALEKKVNDALAGLMTFNDIYPVGSIYISLNSSIPSSFKGTWQKLATGRALWNAESDSQLGVAINGGMPQPSFNKGGASHVSSGMFEGGGTGWCTNISTGTLTMSLSGVDTISSGIRPTSIGCSMWKRIA